MKFQARAIEVEAITYAELHAQLLQQDPNTDDAETVNFQYQGVEITYNAAAIGKPFFINSRNGVVQMNAGDVLVVEDGQNTSDISALVSMGEVHLYTADLFAKDFTAI